MPAIVVMLLIAFPLLPLFGVWVSWVASTGGPTQIVGYTEPPTAQAGHVDQSRGHTPAPRGLYELGSAPVWLGNEPNFEGN